MDAHSLAQQVSQFRADAERWLGTSQNVRGMTGWYGIMARACEQLELIVKQAALCASSAVSQPQALIATQTIGRGKPVDKFTMGEYAQLLLTLKVELKRVLTKDQSESEPIGPLFPKELERLLNGVMSARNDFGHGRFRTQTASVDGERASFDPGAKTDEFLTNGLQLIAFPLFQRLALLDNGEDDT